MLIDKEDLKSLEGQSWKLIAFKQEDRSEQHPARSYYFDSIFFFNKKERADIRLTYEPSANTVSLLFFPHTKNEQILVMGARLVQSIFELFKDKTQKHRLKIATQHLIVENSPWVIDLPIYEKAKSREEVFLIQDTLENAVNDYWKSGSTHLQPLNSFYVLGTKGSYAVELLSDEMFLMDFEKVGSGLYRLTMKKDIFSTLYHERMPRLISSVLRNHGINTIEF